jgi:hypothetical protein
MTVTEASTEFTTTVSHYLIHLVKTAKDRLQWPVSSLRLLCFFMEIATRMESNGLMKLSLRDIARFERTLEELAERSTELELVLRREGRVVYLLDVALSSKEGSTHKKRKRSDEDDSGEDEAFENVPSTNISSVLSTMDQSTIQQLRSLLERPSAKSRLLAKRVSSLNHTPCCPHLCQCSFNLRTKYSNQYAVL